jgi:drug/metabolite transporter (DMT)-like permease
VLGGLVAAFAGVAIVVALGSDQEPSLEGAQGPLILLGAPLSFALYNVLLQPLLRRHGVLELTAASSLVGTLALVPLIRPSTVAAVPEMSAADVGLVLYLGIVCTFCGYLGWNVGLGGLGATRAVAYTYAIPALAVGLGAVALGERVDGWLVAGGALIVLGVGLVQKGPGRGRRDALPSGPAPVGES